MKLFTKTAVAAMLSMSLAAAADAGALRLGTAAPEGSPWGKFLAGFAAKTAELSGGELTITPFWSQELGDEQTMVRQAARGRVDIVAVSNTAISLLVPEYSLMSAPYIFDSPEQADCVYDKHMRDAFGAELDAAGIVPLADFEVGQQIIFSKSLIKTPADLAGTKIRTAPTIPDSVFMEEAGGVAVPLGGVDTMPALKTGSVTAVTWPTVFGIAVGYAQEAPFVPTTNHVYQVGLVAMSKKTAAGLSEQEMGWVIEAATAMNGLRGAIRGAEGALIGKIKGAGLTVHDPDADELAAWKAVAPAAQARIVSEMGGNAAEVWDRVQAAKAACTN